MNSEENPPSAPPLLLPRLVTPLIRIPLPDGGFILKPGQPVFEEEEIGTRAAAQILGLSQRRVNDMCEDGILLEGRDWWRPPGHKRRGQYHLKRTSVMRLKQRAN